MTETEMTRSRRRTTRADEISHQKGSTARQRSLDMKTNRSGKRTKGVTSKIQRVTTFGSKLYQRWSLSSAGVHPLGSSVIPHWENEWDDPPRFDWIWPESCFYSTFPVLRCVRHWKNALSLGFKQWRGLTIEYNTALNTTPAFFLLCVNNFKQSEGFSVRVHCWQHT